MNACLKMKSLVKIMLLIFMQPAYSQEPQTYGVFSTIATNLTGDYKYSAGVAVGTKVYAIPLNQDNVGVIDTVDGTFSTIATGLTGDAKYLAGVVVGTKVYALPYQQNDVGVIDTVAGTFSTIATGLTGDAKYYAGVVVGTKVYALPFEQNDVGVFFPTCSEGYTVDENAICTAVVGLGCSLVDELRGCDATTLAKIKQFYNKHPDRKCGN